MIEFNENQIGECPNCGNYISELEPYCDHCGFKWPSSEKQKGIQEKYLILGEHNPHDEVTAKKLGITFCPECGIKLL